MKEFKRIRYYCSVCKKEHPVDIPLNIIEKRKNFPVSYFTLHKYQGITRDKPDFVEADVLASLYIDQQFHIRGAEAFIVDSSANIMAQEDAEKLIQFLTNHILELQELNEELVEKLQKFDKKKK